MLDLFFENDPFFFLARSLPQRILLSPPAPKLACPATFPVSVADRQPAVIRDTFFLFLR